jgi:homoserine O-succinyltransferase
MPDAALAATERQFGDLFQAAASHREIEIVPFDIPSLPRDPAVRARMAGRYRSSHALAEAGLHALVVTGAEPGDGPLTEAPFWSDFTRVVDDALALRLPTLWSCLAAHAAVLHLDGIERLPLPAKHSGVFTCAPVLSDPLLAGLKRPWAIPHSRRNGLDEAVLAAHGYEILTRSDVVGVDSFVRRGPPLFLFCQGHPEYDRNALALEYKRDLRAYLTGAADAIPALPRGAFNPQGQRKLAALAQAAAERRSPDLMRDWPPSASLGLDDAEWRGFAAGLYQNWLESAL